MRRENLPDEDNVVHYLGWTKLDDEGSIHPEAFRLPENKTRTDLSVCWLEYFACKAKKEQIAEARHYMQLDALKLGSKGVLAEFNVGTVKEDVYNQCELTVRFVHDPTELNHSHALVIGLPAHDSPYSKRVSYIIRLIAIKHPAVP